MLTCKEVVERASGLIDGELSGWELWKMRLHLFLCRGCSHFVGQLRQTNQLAADCGARPDEQERSAFDDPGPQHPDFLSRLHTKAADRRPDERKA